MLDRTKAPETYDIEAITLPTAEVVKLQNGARLHLIKNKTQPVIRLDFVFKAGKWFETGNGVSDLTAKMLLEGTVNRTASQISEIVASYGASFEGNHGYDRAEFTLYCLSKYFEQLLPLVLDVLQDPSFPQEEFNLLKQRSIQNIKLQRQKNNYLATRQFTKLIYGSKHPYLYGFEADAFDNLKIQDLVSFYKSQYHLGNMEVFACGAIDAGMKKALTDGIESLNLQSNAIGTKALLPIVGATTEHYSLVEMPESLQNSIRIGRQFPSIHTPDYLKLTIVNEVLGGYFGSRLMRNIREDKGYTYGIYSVISAKEHDTLFYIGTDVNYAVTEETIHEIKKELEILQQDLVQEDELDTVKNYMLGKLLNDISTIFEQCDHYKRIILQDLPQDHYTQLVHVIRDFKSDELQKLAQAYFSFNDMQVAVAGRSI